MPSTKRRVTAKLERFRGRHHKLDHVIHMVTHYSSVGGNAQAGAVTFFGFLSVFPILALGFFAVGMLAQVYPDLKADISTVIENVLPGVVGSDQGEIPLSTFENYAATVGTVGLLVLLYSGLGWLSGMRVALETMFVLPEKEHPNFVFGKLRDLGTLVLLGLVLLVSVALSALVAGFSELLLEWVGADPDGVVPNALLWLLSHGLAVGASTVLLLALFKLLAQPHVPRRSLFDGALLGAIGFEVLKAAAYFLIEQTKGNPAFQVFGVSLILLIWINYFSRLVLYAASYAYTSPAAVRLREQTAAEAATSVEGAAMDVAAVEGPAVDVAAVRAPGLEPQADPDSVPEPEPSRAPAPVQAGSVNVAPAAGRHSAAAPRDQRALATVGALVAAAGAGALLAWRRARMSR
jgi:membrane protein